MALLGFPPGSSDTFSNDKCHIFTHYLPQNAPIPLTVSQIPAPTMPADPLISGISPGAQRRWAPTGYGPRPRLDLRLTVLP